MKKGIQLAVYTAIISGISIFANALFVSKTDPLIFAFIRNVIVTVFISLLLIGTSKIREVTSLSKRQWWSLAAIGIIGGGVPFALFFTGLSQIGAVNGNLIQKSLFLWVALLAIPLLKERIGFMQFVGYLVLFVGMFFFGGSVTVLPKMGTWLVLTATVLWAIEHVIAKRALQTVSSLVVAWGRMLFGLPCLLVAIGIVGKTGLLTQSTAYVWGSLIVSSLLLTAYVSVWYQALSKAPATLVSSVLVIAPVVTALLSHFVLHKPIVEGQMLSFGLLLVGVVFMMIGKQKLHQTIEV